MEIVPYYDLSALLIAATPVAAVLGWTFVRAVQSIFGKPLNLSRKETQQLLSDLKYFKDENAYLSQRVDNLETIITSVDPELLESSMRLQSPDFRSSYHKVEQAMRRNHAKSQTQRSTPESGESLGKNVKNLLNKLVRQIDKALDEQNTAARRNNRYRF